MAEFQVFPLFLSCFFSKNCGVKGKEESRREKINETNVHWEVGLQANP